jgi:hypothetical protein
MGGVGGRRRALVASFRWVAFMDVGKKKKST